MGFWGRITDFLAPELCLSCGSELAEPGRGLCQDCQSQFSWLPETRCPGCGGPADSLLGQCPECLKRPEQPWETAVSVFAFEGLARTAVHRLKYRGRRELAPFFAARMAENWREHSGGFQPDVVTPVPLHWFRWLKRGYNQSGDVAYFLARELGIPCEALLRRCRHTAPQASLDAKKRQDNLKSAFAGKGKVQGRKILLVDDVFTTGATLTAAAKALLQSKARGVAVITIARDL